MKKLMFLTMMFGLLMIFSGSASAQQTYEFAIGSGSTTPAAGMQFVSALHTRTNSEKNAPAGTKYLVVKIMKDGKQLTGGQMQLTPAQAKALEGRKGDNFTVTKVDNPLPMRPYDGIKLTIYSKPEYVDIQVIQGNAKKNLGTMRLYLK